MNRKANRKSNRICKTKKVVSVLGAAFFISCVIAIVGIAKENAKAISQETAKESIKDLYPATGIVTELNHAKDLVTVTTGNGNQFQFYGIEDWNKGDLCSMLMNDKGTEIVFDDEVEKAYYAGTMEMFNENFIDMSKVTEVYITETGAYLNFMDNTGYYWER